MVLTRSFTRNNILLDVSESDTTNNLNYSVSIPLSHSSPSILLENSEDQQTTVFQNSINMNNQAFNFPVNNTISSSKRQFNFLLDFLPRSMVHSNRNAV